VAASLQGARWRRVVRRDWERAAAVWERWESQHLNSLAAVDPVLLRELRLRPGQRVLDVGCGIGEPSLAVAAWLAPAGRVVGIDIARPMLAVARRRARARGLRNVRFRVGEITQFRPRGARFDRVVSRYGLMFAEDVPLALRRIHAALRPGGRVALAVWGPAERNATFTLSIRAMRRYLTGPQVDPERSPHPLRLGRPGLLPRLLREAGFRAVHVFPVESPFVHGSAAEFATERLACSAPLRKVYRRLGPAERVRAHERVRRAVLRYRSGRVVRVPALAWVVSARR
jgi:SAM-dependent methyltransferase